MVLATVVVIDTAGLVVVLVAEIAVPGVPSHGEPEVMPPE